MDRLKKFEKSNIEKVLKDNFSKLMPTFYEMESSFLAGVYKRYGDLEGGNIVIYFARDLHLEILRKRENDLSFDLSLDMFWNNHKDIRQGKKKIIAVSKETGLPKETTRRKIISLIKKKHLKKEDRNRLFSGRAFLSHSGMDRAQDRTGGNAGHRVAAPFLSPPYLGRGNDLSHLLGVFLHPGSPFHEITRLWSFYGIGGHW